MPFSHSYLKSFDSLNVLKSRAIEKLCAGLYRKCILNRVLCLRSYGTYAIMRRQNVQSVITWWAAICLLNLNFSEFLKMHFSVSL
jgi:hypothetical protein